MINFRHIAVQKYTSKVLLGAVLALGIAGAVAYQHTHNEFKNAPAQIGGCNDPAVTAVIYSIQNYPDSWETDNFKMWHGNDVGVWTANEDYGLSLSLGSKDAQPDQYQMSDNCRAVLYDTTQTWLRNTLNEKLRG